LTANLTAYLRNETRIHIGLIRPLHALENVHKCTPQNEFYPPYVNSVIYISLSGFTDRDQQTDYGTQPNFAKW